MQAVTVATCMTGRRRRMTTFSPGPVADALKQNPQPDRWSAIGAAAGTPSALAGKHGLHNKRAPGAALDSVFAGTDPGALLGTYMQAIRHGNGDVDAMRLRDSLDVRNAMSERVPSGGGFLVPENLREQILQTARGRSGTCGCRAGPRAARLRRGTGPRTGKALRSRVALAARPCG